MPALSLKRVPLPEVANVTDTIVFGNLGLPNGLDPEHLLVNVQRLELFQKIAGLGIISITAAPAKNMQYQTAITGIDQFGAATGIATAHSAAPERGSAKNQSSTRDFIDNFYIRPDSAVTLPHEQREKLMQSASKKGVVVVRDPVPQAYALNKILQQGLSDASRQANISPVQLATSSAYYALLAAPSLGDTKDTLNALITGTAGWIPASAIMLAAMEGISPKEALRLVRKSIVAYAGVDRHAAALALNATSTYIHPAK
jgi:hypothetical protein